MSRLVDLCSTQPARLFGLFPRKGTIAVGSDADIVIWDSEKPLTLSASTHHSNVDYNLFEGTEVIGAPELVMLRGQVIVENDELVAAPGVGRFLARARFGEEPPAAHEPPLART
jgi:dihydropyrimidinase